MELPSFDKVKPIFSIIGNILKTADLVDKGIPPTFQDLILPSLLITYGPPILANGIYKKYEFTLNDFVVYLIGFLISIPLHSKQYFISVVGNLPMISKAFGAIKTARDPEFTVNVLVWNLVCDFIGNILKKMLLKKKLKIKGIELFSIIFVNCGLFTIKEFRLPVFLAVAVVSAVPLYNKVSDLELMKYGKKDKLKNQQSGILNTPSKNMPRRKASVANLLNQKNK